MGDVFDVVIIGAGTAGCVLANRLSEDPRVSVLLLESGEDRSDDERIYTPGLASELLDNDLFDWQYLAEPDSGINNRRMKHPRGKVVGGTSAINSFALIYPSVAGMDAWAALGNDGWGWDGMERYFRKFQTICRAGESLSKALKIPDPEEGMQGPIQANYPQTAASLQTAWIETFSTLNLRNEKDPLSGQAYGGYISTNHISSERRERSHAGVAYLNPVRGRQNLSLITGAHVERLILEKNEVGTDTVATGVQYRSGDGIKQVSARKEILLAAGVFSTPQILELSGIGDKDRLDKLDIPSIYHNPNVGENLQDHIRLNLFWEPVDGFEVTDPMPASQARRLYEESRSGPWAERACYTFSYMPLTPFLPDDDKWRLENMFKDRLHQLQNASTSKFESEVNDFVRRATLSPQETTATTFLSRRKAIPDQNSKDWIALCAMLSYPLSRGNVHIDSPNDNARPKIDFRYYSDPIDLEVHARHLQILERLAQTPPLSKYIKHSGVRLPSRLSEQAAVNEQPSVNAEPMVTEPLPEMESLTVEQAKEFLKQYATTNYHPCGTCSMLPESLGGVVDSKLRVHGTKNVRVVDASIFPIIPRGNIITTVYAVAEKAADIIKVELSFGKTE